jgi:hypothetical protein
MSLWLLACQLAWKLFMMWQVLQNWLVLVSSTPSTEKRAKPGRARIAAHRNRRRAQSRLRIARKVRSADTPPLR